MRITVNPKQADNPTIGADFAKNPHINDGFRSQDIFSGEAKWSDSRINGRTLPKIRIKCANSGMRTIRIFGFHGEPAKLNHDSALLP